MIFILFLIHFLSRGVGAEQDYILGSRAPTNSCDDINNCRRLFDIVWGCATTIFAAIWVSVHLNVPLPNHSWLALLWRRLKMMLVAVIAPEVMVGFTARHFVMARSWSSGELDFPKFQLYVEWPINAYRIRDLENTRVLCLHGWLCHSW
jgi:hypothetical protein